MDIIFSAESVNITKNPPDSSRGFSDDEDDGFVPCKQPWTYESQVSEKAIDMDNHVKYQLFIFEKELSQYKPYNQFIELPDISQFVKLPKDEQARISAFHLPWLNLLHHDCKAQFPNTIHPTFKPKGFNFTSIPVPCLTPIENTLNEYFTIQQLALECAITMKIMSIAEAKQIWLPSILDKPPNHVHGPVTHNPGLGYSLTTRTILSDYACQLANTLRRHMYDAVTKGRQFEFDECMVKLQHIKRSFPSHFTSVISAMHLPEELEKYRPRYITLGLESFHFYITKADLVSLPRAHKRLNYIINDFLDQMKVATSLIFIDCLGKDITLTYVSSENYSKEDIDLYYAELNLPDCSKAESDAIIDRYIDIPLFKVHYSPYVPTSPHISEDDTPISKLVEILPPIPSFTTTYSTFDELVDKDLVNTLTSSDEISNSNDINHISNTEGITSETIAQQEFTTDTVPSVSDNTPVHIQYVNKRAVTDIYERALEHSKSDDTEEELEKRELKELHRELTLIRRAELKEARETLKAKTQARLLAKRRIGFGTFDQESPIPATQTPQSSSQSSDLRRESSRQDSLQSSLLSTQSDNPTSQPAQDSTPHNIENSSTVRRKVCPHGARCNRKLKCTRIHSQADILLFQELKSQHEVQAGQIPSESHSASRGNQTPLPDSTPPLSSSSASQLPLTLSDLSDAERNALILLRNMTSTPTNPTASINNSSLKRGLSSSGVLLNDVQNIATPTYNSLMVTAPTPPRVGANNPYSFILSSDNLNVFAEPYQYCVQQSPPRKKRKGVSRTRIRKHYPQTLNLLNIGNSLPNKGVNVLCNAHLSKEEINILTLGMKFVPIPTRTNDDVISDSINDFCRKVRIKRFFLIDKETSLLSQRVCRFSKLLHMKLITKKQLAPSIFIPPPAGKYIEHYLEKITRKSNSLLHTIVPYATGNPNDCFFNRVNLLRSRNDIIIKPADKNLGPTVMDRSWYFSEALSIRHLGDINTYQMLLEKPSAINIREQLMSILSKHHLLYLDNAVIESTEQIGLNGFTSLAKDLLCNLTEEDVKLSKLYFLPKIHKSPIALRPICATIGTATYAASLFLDILLQDTMKLAPSFIQNSGMLVKRLETTVFPNDCILLEADVENLYPSIIITEGLQSLEYKLLTTKPIGVNTSYVLELANWVLSNNYIEFGDRMFLQIKGTAMGTPFAVAFACIHLAVLEEHTFSIINKEFPLPPLLYYRYIDDIFAVFLTRPEAELFITTFNSMSSSIRVTYSISSDKANFLDIKLSKGLRFQASGRLDIELHQKPVNKFLFLPPFSFHHRNVFASWIASYIKRIRLNCSDDDTFERHKYAFYQQLQQRGYTERQLSPIFSIQLIRETLLSKIALSKHPRTNDSNTDIPLIIKLPYNPRVKALLPYLKAITRVQEYPRHDPFFKEIFGQRGTPLYCFTREKNLKDLLTVAAIPVRDIPTEFKYVHNPSVHPYAGEGGVNL